MREQLSLLPTEDRNTRSVRWDDLPIQAREELFERMAVLLLQAVRPDAMTQELYDEPIEDSNDPSRT